MKTIKFDMNNVNVPIEVINSFLSGHIQFVCKNYYKGKEVPDELKLFCDNNDRKISDDWTANLLNSAPKMSDELVEKWVDELPSGWARSKLMEEAEKRNFVKEPAEEPADPVAQASQGD